LVARVRFIIFPRLTRGKEGSDCQYPQFTYKGQQVALMVFSSGLSFCSRIGDAQHWFQGSIPFSSLNHPLPKSSHKGRRCHLQDQADIRRSLLVVKVLDYHLSLFIIQHFHCVDSPSRPLGHPSVFLGF
jgi:hypothetical protein